MGGGWVSGFGLWKLLCWSWSGCLAEGPSVYMEGWTPGPAATVWAPCVVEAKQIAYLHWINTGTKKLLTGAKGPAACLSAPVTLISIVTIILRGAASIDNWQGNAPRTKLKPLALFAPTDQMRSMLSCMAEAEGGASVRTVDSTRRIAAYCKSAPIASQNPHHIAANTVTFLSRPQVRIDDDVLFFSLWCPCSLCIRHELGVSFVFYRNPQWTSEIEGTRESNLLSPRWHRRRYAMVFIFSSVLAKLILILLRQCQCWYVWTECIRNQNFLPYLFI